MNEMRRRIAFFKTALSDRNVAALTMSSKYVVKNVLKRFSKPLGTVVECGSGDGAITRAVLEHVSPKGKFFAIEPNAGFMDTLKRIEDSRLTVLHVRAEQVLARSDTYRIGRPDLIMASLPFSFLDSAARVKFVEDAYRILAPGGILIIFYQYSFLMRGIMRKIFGAASLSCELRNIPPCFIISARKEL